MQNFSGTFCQKILRFFLDDVPILKLRNRNFWNSCSFPVHHNSSFLKFPYPLFYLISSTCYPPSFATSHFSSSHSFRPFPHRFVSQTVRSLLQTPTFLCISCYLSVREFARSQPTTLEYLYGDPLTFKVYVNLQQRRERKIEGKKEREDL